MPKVLHPRCLCRSCSCLVLTIGWRENCNQMATVSCGIQARLVLSCSSKQWYTKDEFAQLGQLVNTTAKTNVPLQERSSLRAGSSNKLAHGRWAYIRVQDPSTHCIIILKQAMAHERCRNLEEYCKRKGKKGCASSRTKANSRVVTRCVSAEFEFCAMSLLKQAITHGRRGSHDTCGMGAS